MEELKKQGSLAEIGWLFFRLGCIGFGGPAVHIAMMEEEFVRKRKWLSEQQFLDLIGATNLIPGPNSTEMTMHIGKERAGWKGLFIAGLSFIFPAVIITGFFAWLYQKYGRLPEVQPFIYGIKPAIIAVIIALVINLGRKALKNIELGIIGLLAAIAVLWGLNQIYVLFGGGFLGILGYLIRRPTKKLKSFLPLILLQSNSAVGDFTNLKLFLVFLKIGSILYGSGYVLFAFLDAELVAKGLLSKQELADAIAVGQFTPGPVFSSATFVGWQIAGMSGAVMATIGIFLPSFLFVALLNPLVAKLRKSAVFSVFLDTVNIVSIALILCVVIEMGQMAVHNWRTVLIAVASFLVTFLFRRLNTAFVILGGSLLGYFLTFF